MRTQSTNTSIVQTEIHLPELEDLTDTFTKQIQDRLEDFNQARITEI